MFDRAGTALAAAPDLEPVTQSEPLRVVVSALDPLCRAGLLSQLAGQADIVCVDADAAAGADVGLVVADDVTDEVTAGIRSLRHGGLARVVLIATRVDDSGLLAAVEAGATGLVRRGDVSPKNLAAAIRSSAAGDGTLPPDLLGRLLEQVGHLQRTVLHPRGLSFTGLTEREVRVLQLLSEGCDTTEVGRRLFYSERTVKNIIHDVTSRLDLRNRTHAVAWALRQGLI